MSEKLEELISLLYQDRLTQYGKRLLVENIVKLQKENEEFEEINNELEAEKNEAIRRYNFETIPIKKVKDKIEKLKQERTLKYDNYMGYKIESREQQDIDKKVQVLQELLDGSDTSVGSIGSED